MRATGRGRSRLPTEQGAQCETRSQDLGSWLEPKADAKPTEPSRRPPLDSSDDTVYYTE